MAELVYVLCAAMSLLCAIMLWRGYRRSHTKLLLWSSFCFGFFALNNIILVVDMVILPDVEMAGPFWRNLIGTMSGTVLLFGLIWELT